MILTTHAIIGAAIGSAMPTHPELAFVLSFASHFALDAIPHWDYKLHSTKEDPLNPLNNVLFNHSKKNAVIDLTKICADGFLGVILGLFLFSDLSIFSSFHLSIFQSSVFWGIVGALMPDFLQFAYFKIWRHEPIRSLQKFHIFLNRPKLLKNRPVIGSVLQIILMIITITIFKFII